MTLSLRLERNELIFFPACPFALPDGQDRAFLAAQEVGPYQHKNVSYDPATGTVSGFRRRDVEQANRLRRILADFSARATAWLAGELPEYAAAWQLDRATLRPEEEATRSLRQTARNDLLHVAAFPTRPSGGRRLLRLYVNINPDEERVWVTSEPFERLLARYALNHRIPARSRDEWSRPVTGWRRLWDGGWSGRSAYDAFMLRLHHFLKSDDTFQERSPKRYWHFPPGSAWLLFADGFAHAELRGRLALEHSYFVPQAALALPEESPLALLERAGRAREGRRAG